MSVEREKYIFYINLFFKNHTTVNRLNGSVPVKYGLRLNMDEKYKALKRELSLLSGIPAEQLLLVEIQGPIVKVNNSRHNLALN